MAHGWVPAATANLIIRVGTCRGEEVTPLRDILFTLLPSDLNLLLFATTSKIVLLQGTFGLVG